MIRLLIIVMISALPLYAETLDDLMETQRMIHSIKADFYEQKEGWDSVKGDMQERYSALKKAVEKRETYLIKLNNVNSDLAEDLRAQEKKLEESSTMKKRLSILLTGILSYMQEHIEKTAGYTYKSRSESVSKLMKLSADPEVQPQEKIRRVMELFMVEADLARFAEAYEERIELNGEVLSGYLLRLGALGQFFTTQDGSKAAVYDPAAKGFVGIDSSYSAEILKAARIIDKRSAPELLYLPIGRIEQ